MAAAGKSAAQEQLELRALSMRFTAVTVAPQGGSGIAAGLKER